LFILNIIFSWADGMAQVAECLPSKCKTLTSNPTTTNINKQQQKRKNITIQNKMTKESTVVVTAPFLLILL
jgi:hypothetical protein